MFGIWPNLKTTKLSVLKIALILGLSFVIWLLQSPTPKTPVAEAEEIQAIKKSNDLEVQTTELKKLLARVGAVESQELLYRSGLPFTGQTHLLVHVIGDYVYKEEGLAGLPQCREYFLSACYHGFVINALSDYGLTGVGQALTECDKAGTAVMGQCSHAAGHGFLAWQDYNLPQALNMCDEAGEIVKNFGHFNCHDGVFMENFWGVHDGKPSEKRWLSETDIYYPCTDKRILEKYLPGCWANQATVIYQHFKGDLRKTAEACDNVENENFKRTCYNNFARQIHPLTQGKTDKAFELCQTATDEWQNYCLEILVGASWSVGDKTDMPYGICERIANKTRCYDHLYSLFLADAQADRTKIETYCKKIKDSLYREQCLQKS